MGNGICCPSVCYHKAILGKSIFQSGYHYALDWDVFVQIARKKGRFTYIPKELFYYRIHDGATTKACSEESGEDQGRTGDVREVLAGTGGEASDAVL